MCITPHVFDHSHINPSNWKDLNSLLQVLSISGFILGLNGKDWARTVSNKLWKIDPKIKDKLSATLSLLRNRDRIVGHPKAVSFSGSHEDDWFNVAQELNEIRDFYRIIATQPYGGKALSIEQLEDINISEEFGFTGSTQILKTTDNLYKLLLPFLSYSKKVTIIDPYFYLDRHQCKKTLGIVAKCFRERRGKKESGSIIIHCKWDDEKSSYNVEKWKNIINKTSKTHNHRIELCAWERRDDSVKLHDRYIITNQSGLVSAAGTDIDDWQQSEWSIKDYGELSKILSQYNKNSSPFELKCTVTASSIDFF